MKWVNGLIDRMSSAAGALLLAQMPMFILQYHQQLSGRAAELRLQIDSIRRIATESGKSLPQFIQKFTDMNDPDFIKQGQLISLMGERFQFLSQAEENLANSSAIQKPFIFFQQIDWDIAANTWHHFQFGIPFSSEGLAYALIGLILGCILFNAVNSIYDFIMKFCFSSFRKRKKGEP